MSAADDRHEIGALVHAYAERVDAGDVDGVADLFAHATLVSSEGIEFSGRDTLRELWADGLQLHDGSPRTHHLITNLVIDLDEDGLHARARSYATAVQATPDLPLQVVVASRHHDRFEKVDETWRFVERRDFRDLAGDLSQHFRVPSADS